MFAQCPIRYMQNMQISKILLLAIVLLLAPIWAVQAQTIQIVQVETTAHNMGSGAEGSLFQKSFSMPAQFLEATLEFDITGPNYERSPYAEINGNSAGSLQPFFPGVNQTNPDGSHDYNGWFHVSLPVTTFLTSGSNVFTWHSGRPDDHYTFANVQIRFHSFSLFATYYVSTLGNDANSGLDPAHPKRHIQNAFDTSSNGDQIWVAVGTYYEDIVVYAGRQIFGGYNSSYTSRSSDPTQTIIDGGGSGNVVTHGSTVTTPHRLIDGFTIQHGNTGFSITGSDITISHCIITNNHSTNGAGGGIDGSSGTPTITNCVITNNSTTGQGGGINLVNSSPTITNSTISGNSAVSYGSGIHCVNCTSYIAGNTITNNTTMANEAVTLYQGSSTFINNTVSGNHAANYNGAMSVDYGSFTISGNTITDNSAVLDIGAIYFNHTTSLTLTDNTITGNSSGYTGGVEMEYCQGVTISGNTFSKNTGDHVGGLYIDNSVVDILNNTFEGNAGTTNALDTAGGLFLSVCSGTVSGNLITGNSSATYGGGIRTYNSSLMILNNKIIGNSAKKNSGGIEWDSSSGTIANNLIADNKAAQYGGGVTIADTPAPVVINNTLCNNSAVLGIGGINVYRSSPLIANNIVAFNQNGGVAEYTGNTLSHNCVYGNTVFNFSGINPGPGDISADPLFVNAAAGDYRLRNISPCLDVGDNSAVDPAWTDLDGLPRIVHGLVDIGAYEFQGTSADVTSQVQVMRGPLVYDPKAKTYTQVLTLKNSGGAVIAGPLQAVLAGLSSGVMLANATGTYAGIQPYLTASSGALLPGGSISLKAVFQNPANARFTYKIKVYSASF